jgi:hypothetical protein
MACLSRSCALRIRCAASSLRTCSKASRQGLRSRMQHAMRQIAQVIEAKTMRRILPGELVAEEGGELSVGSFPLEVAMG